MSAPSTLWLLDDQRLGRKEPNMLIIGADYHPSFQQIAFCNQDTGECGERRLNHSDGESRKISFLGVLTVLTGDSAMQ
jgi:hypothetical protein